MKITHIETYPTRIPLKPERRMVSALGRHEVSDFLLVRLGTDVGVEAAGEATVTPRWSGETALGAKHLIDRLLAPALIGADPADVTAIDARLDALCAHNWFAKAALEMACWDAVGKQQNQPLYELLGGAVRAKTFRCRFSMGAYDLPRAVRTARERVDAGFTTIKVKVGGHLDDDLERVRAVRAEIGPDLDLVIDANGGWDADTAIRAASELADARVALFEQPTPARDFAALARVRRETDLEILADDICFDLADAAELIRQQACDCISVYPGKQGGIRKTTELARLAASHNIPCSVGSNLEWDVATAAMAHSVVATENIRVERYPGDVLGPSYHEFSIAKNPLHIDGPLVTVPDGPGLGVDVDWQCVRENPIPAK